jgi:hypothetical protein
VANSLTRLPPLVLGGPFAYGVSAQPEDGPPVDWLATECHLYMCRPHRFEDRVELHYVPGGPSNDGGRVQVGDVWEVQFKKTIEWVIEHLSPGDYELWVRPGSETGHGQAPARVQAVLSVTLPIDGQPL